MFLGTAVYCPFPRTWRFIMRWIPRIAVVVIAFAIPFVVGCDNKSTTSKDTMSKDKMTMTTDKMDPMAKDKMDKDKMPMDKDKMGK